MILPYRFLRGWTGQIVDLWRLAAGTFSNPHSYTKFRTINALRKRTRSKIFIETGTYYGLTAARCASVFDRVFTIELHEGLAAGARAFLAGKPNTRVIQGDAVVELPRIMQQADVHSALVFLDGHFSGGPTACGPLPEPAVVELEQLAKFREKLQAIIVDDFRCFGTEPGFPSKASLLKTAEDHFGYDDFAITVHLDQLIIVRNR